MQPGFNTPCGLRPERPIECPRLPRRSTRRWVAPGRIVGIKELAEEMNDCCPLADRPLPCGPSPCAALGRPSLAVQPVGLPPLDRQGRRFGVSRSAGPGLHLRELV